MADSIPTLEINLLRFREGKEIYNNYYDRKETRHTIYMGRMNTILMGIECTTMCNKMCLTEGKLGSEECMRGNVRVSIKQFFVRRNFLQFIHSAFLST